MKSNQRRKQKLLASREAARGLEAREDARVETLVRLGHTAGPYAGRTPHHVDGAPTFGARVMQVRMSTHEGSTRRAGKKNTLKFVPRRFDAGAPKGGGAHLAPGDRLSKPTKQSTDVFVERTAVGNTAFRPDRGGLAGVTVRYAADPINYRVGDADAKLPEDTDPGDDERTTLERAYWARVHNADTAR